jgi:hypothetical protein
VQIQLLSDRPDGRLLRAAEPDAEAGKTKPPEGGF